MKKKSNILMLSLDLGGNLPPMLGLAAKLKAAGHEVSVLTEPCLEEVVVKKYQLRFLPFTDYFTRSDRHTDIIQDSEAGPFSNPAFDNIMFGPARTVIHQAIEAIKTVRADMIIADMMLFPALMAGEVAGIPRVLVFHMPEFMPAGNRPPGNMGLLPGRGLLGKLRDRLLARLFYGVFNKYKKPLNTIRRELQLAPIDHVPDLVHDCELRLMQTSEAFDIPMEPRPANVVYTGPVLDDPDWVGDWKEPWPSADRRPLVVISLSSTFQNQQRTIQHILDGMKGLDCKGLLTLGPAMEEASFECPENVFITASAPHSLVFPKASVVITHAGHGTLMRAFSHGLPVLCLPMGRDQDDNAAKAQYRGCGLKLKPGAKPAAIRKAIQRLLREDSFREETASLGQKVLESSRSDDDLLAIEKLLQPSVATKKAAV